MRWPKHGEAPPPYDSNTPEFHAWYARIRKEYRTSDSPLAWAEYYAQAKMEAMYNPMMRALPGFRGKAPKLFGTSSSNEYREWYRKTLAAHRALPTHEQNWPEFFAKAKAVEMRRQGVNSPHLSQVHVKPNNVVPLNPILTLPPDFDGPLRFDFSIQP